MGEEGLHRVGAERARGGVRLAGNAVAVVEAVEALRSLVGPAGEDLRVFAGGGRRGRLPEAERAPEQDPEVRRLLRVPLGEEIVEIPGGERRDFGKGALDPGQDLRRPDRRVLQVAVRWRLRG